MTNDELDRSLRQLRLGGMADTLSVRSQQAQAESLGPLDFISLLVHDELQRRRDRLIERRVKAAGFRDQRTLDAFDWKFNTLDRALIFELANGRFIEQHEDALLLGNAGVGKSHIAQAIGMAAIGNRAVYHDGWVAGCRHGRLPWLTAASASFDDDTWELYNIEEDFSQATDLAAQNPAKLHELQDLFLAEAAKYGVLPLDDRFAERGMANLRPSNIAGIKNFVYLPGTVRLPEPSSPDTKNVNHVLAAEIEIPAGGAEGVLVCCGGASGGYTLFVQDGKLHWEHNWFGEARYAVSSSENLKTGHQIVSAEIQCDDEGKMATGGTVTLRMGETTIGSGRFEKQIYGRFTVNETFDVGCDTVTPVSDRYESPFAFTGTIKRVMVDVSDRSFDDLAAEVRRKNRHGYAMTQAQRARR